MENIKIEYIAGLFDGEGSVTITNKKGNYYGVLSICNTHREVIFEIQKSLLGSVHESNRIGSNYTIYKWHASHRKAFNAAKLLIPHSIIKRKELEAMVQFVNISYPYGIQARTCARWKKMDEYYNLKYLISKEAEKHINLLSMYREECRVRI